MLYSISDLEQLSGIQSHTIRAWEQRYNALKPMRTEGNTRFYDDSQLKKLLNIVMLNQSGLKISKICSLSDSDLLKMLDAYITLAPEKPKFDYFVTQLIKSGLAYDEYAFDKLLTACIDKFGMSDAYRYIMYQVLVRLGLMWQKDNICPAQEHYLANIIKRKIFKAIDELPLKENSKETWLLFLPEDEEHDIGLLFSHYILRANNKKVIFLGARVPLTSIKKVLLENKIDSLLFFMVGIRYKKTAQKYLDDLQAIGADTKINIAGNTHLLNQLTMSENVTIFNTLEDFERIIKKPEIL
ncbi:MerR family transcriptional regulator [Pedobacter aquatilis]|uniref:MerR family transcriptional regulator n=1 Tax=Pedobacter aquatilis TaxID=351343 RepID=UPI00292D5EAA|nr:MerR family transcriptional regulator [Pedobacter aquatilis]